MEPISTLQPFFNNEVTRTKSSFAEGMSSAMYRWIYAVILVTVILVPGWTSDQDGSHLSSRVVNTRYGMIRGFISTLSNRHLQPVEVFLGVPYAGAPVGALRFMPPVTSPHWKEIRVADHLSPVCPQRYPDVRNETDALRRMPLGRLNYLKRLIPHLVNQSEDCLYLNIYVPADASRNFGKLPVMMFIHGESYEWNSGNPYDGRVLASFGNVVVVTINYRLGVLGFLPAVDRTARGNYGLMDQVAALHWIQDNIGDFGGDVDNITIFGQGHGASCVNLLMISPMARGLFRRAIMQSGSALSPWAIARDAITHTQKLAETLDCPSDDSTALVECLRKVPLNRIMAVNFTVPDYLTGFGPTIDGIVLPQEPASLMEEKPEIFTQYDLLFGSAKVESYFQFSAEEEKFGIENSRRDRLLRTLVRNLYTFHLQEIFLTIVNEYMDWTRPKLHPEDIFDGTVEAIGDAIVVAPLIKTGSYHAGSIEEEDADPVPNTVSKTYFYVFSHQTEGGDFATRLGCITGEDLPYVFGAPLVKSLAHFGANYSKPESILSEITMSHWTNFAKIGDPNIYPSRDETQGENIRGRYERLTWPPYEHIHQKFISISMKPRIRDHYHAHRLSYWLNLIPRFHRSGEANESDQHHHLTDHDNFFTYDGVFRKNNNRVHPEVTTISHHVPQIVAEHTTEYHVKAKNSSFMDHVTRIEDNVENTHVQNTSSSEQSSTQSVIYSTALTVTIAVGCALFFLNVLIFAAIYYQKEKVILDKQCHKHYYQDPHSDDEVVHSSEEKPYMVKDISSSIVLSHFGSQQQSFEGSQTLDLVQPSKSIYQAQHLKSCEGHTLTTQLGGESHLSSCPKIHSESKKCHQMLRVNHVHGRNDCAIVDEEDATNLAQCS